MTIVCGYFGFNTMAFTGSDSYSFCYPNSSNNSVYLSPVGPDMALQMLRVIRLGFFTHLLGVFSDAAMVLRVKS